MAHEQDEETIVLPLGVIALNWLRLYLPLVDAGLPQMPRNAGPDGLGFAGAGFRALLDGLVTRLDLRIGACFVGAQAETVHAALRDAADVIARMPTTYITYPNGGPLLPTLRRRAPSIRSKHCGQQGHWSISLDFLQNKCGSNSTEKEFRLLTRAIVKQDEKHSHFPNYVITVTDTDVTFTNRRTRKKVQPRILDLFSPNPQLKDETLDKARKAAPAMTSIIYFTTGQTSGAISAALPYAARMRPSSASAKSATNVRRSTN